MKALVDTGQNELLSPNSLAILGEASVLANAQVGSLSNFSYLPRLLPAPQALIKASRAERLALSTGKVVGNYSLGIRHDLNHVAHILHSGDNLSDYARLACYEGYFRCSHSIDPRPSAQGFPLRANSAEHEGGRDVRNSN